MVLTEVGKANFDVVTEFGGFFFGLGDLSFGAFGEFDFDLGISAASGWTEQSANGLDDPGPIDASASEEGPFARFNTLHPAVCSSFVPIIWNWTGENLNPKLFGVVGVEFGKSTSDAGERINFKIIKSFDW